MKNRIVSISILIFLFSHMNCGEGTSKSDTEALFALLQPSSDNSTPPVDPGPGVQEGTWLADTVTDAPGHTGSGFQDKNKLINGVFGGGMTGGGTDVFSLQYNSTSTPPNDYVVLEWNGYKIRNGSGIDFIVFENGFRVSASPVNYFMDMIIVEVGNDLTNWCGFNPDYTFSPETSYSKDPAYWSRFAGRMPVLFHETNNNFGYDPALVFDLNNSGGDGFNLDDLSEASNSAGGSGCSETLRNDLKTNGFTYLRLSSASSNRWKNPDTNAVFVKEAISNGPDIDGVYARYKISR